MPDKVYSREEILCEIGNVLRRECRINRPDFTEQDRLVEDLGLESMGLMILATQLENNLQIVLDESVQTPPATIGDVATLISVQVNAQ